MQTVWFISGLAANEKAFSLLDLSFCDARFLKWIKPSTGETLSTYAVKLFNIINDEKAIIVGLSFGGMLATEMAIRHPGTKAILLSSTPTCKGVPACFKPAQYLPLAIPLKLLFRNSTLQKLALNAFGSQREEHKRLEQSILNDADPVFNAWATKAILKWENTTTPPNIVRIHGTADKLLPYPEQGVDYPVRRGSHLMVVDRARVVSDLLKQAIADCAPSVQPT